MFGNRNTPAQPLMTMDLEYKPYELVFKTPLKMARGTLQSRKGALIKLSGAEVSGYADLLPLEHFGSEPLSAALAYLKKLDRIDFKTLEKIPEDLPATRFALEVAIYEMEQKLNEENYFRKILPVSKLLPQDNKLFPSLEAGLAEGYSIFKIKIALSDFADELELVKKISSKLLENGRLRLDANEGLSIEQAKRWLQNLEGLPIEFLEQPLKRAMIDDSIALSSEFSTTIALDESIATSDDCIKVYQAGFRGVFAVKPMRLMNLKNFLKWRKNETPRISYSTVFESAIGSLFGIRLAASDPQNSFGLGFGVAHLLKESELILPVAEKVNISSLQAIDPEKIWRNL